MKILSTDQFKGEIKGHYSPSFNFGSSRPTDQWGRQRAPSDSDLIREYETTAYACANLNAESMRTTPLRLYLRSDKRAVSKRYPTKTLTSIDLSSIQHKVRLSSSEQIEEVTDHPVLDFLANGNPDMDLGHGIMMTDLYQEVIGRAYWLIALDSLGRPQNWTLMLPQYVRLTRDSSNRVTAYTYCGETFSVNDPNYLILPFLMPSLTDPNWGFSPLRAVWNSVNVASKLDATQASMLDNEAIPQMLVSPAGEEGFMGSDVQDRYEKKWLQKFRRGAGGVVFTDEPVTIKQLSFSPRDLSALAIKKVTKTDICNGYGVPPALLDGSQINRATLDASRLLHAKQAICPRVAAMQGRLNKFLLPLYDPTGRLFLSFDDPSPENREEKKNEITALVTAHIITPNEARKEYGMPPDKNGDDLFPVQPGMQGLVGNQTDAETDKPADAVLDPTADVQTTALNGAQIDSLLSIATQVAAAELPSETAAALIAAAFPTLSESQIDAILKPLDGFTLPEEEQPAPKPTARPAVPPTPPAPKAKSHKPEFGLPDGNELGKVIGDFYEAKGKEVVSRLTSKSVKKLPTTFVLSENWDNELSNLVRPVIEIYVDEAAKEVLGRVGASPDAFDVTNPAIIDGIKEAAFAFAQSTLDTTTKEINTALSDLRDSLTEGVSEGERLTELADRVKDIFSGLSDSRAFLLAQTEASRAHHYGWLEAAKASGVVVGKKWLLSSDACEYCKAIAEKTKDGIGLDEPFHIDESSKKEYQEVPYAPAHPSCRCTCTEILDIDGDL